MPFIKNSNLNIPQKQCLALSILKYQRGLKTFPAALQSAAVHMSKMYDFSRFDAGNRLQPDAETKKLKDKKTRFSFFSSLP